ATRMILALSTRRLRCSMMLSILVLIGSMHAGYTVWRKGLAHAGAPSELRDDATLRWQGAHRGRQPVRAGAIGRPLPADRDRHRAGAGRHRLRAGRYRAAEGGARPDVPRQRPPRP